MKIQIILSKYKLYYETTNFIINPQQHTSRSFTPTPPSHSSPNSSVYRRRTLLPQIHNTIEVVAE